MDSHSGFVYFEGKYYSTLGGKDSYVSESSLPEILPQSKFTGKIHVTKIWVAKKPTNEKFAYLEYKENGKRKVEKVISGCIGGWLVNEKFHPSVYRYLPAACENEQPIDPVKADY